MDQARARLGPTFSQSSWDSLWDRVLSEVPLPGCPRGGLFQGSPRAVLRGGRKATARLAKASGESEIGPMSAISGPSWLQGTRQPSPRAHALPLHTAEPPQVPVTPRIMSTHRNMDLLLAKPHSSVEYQGDICGTPHFYLLTVIVLHWESKDTGLFPA